MRYTKYKGLIAGKIVDIYTKGCDGHLEVEMGALLPNLTCCIKQGLVKFRQVPMPLTARNKVPQIVVRQENIIRILA